MSVSLSAQEAHSSTETLCALSSGGSIDIAHCSAHGSEVLEAAVSLSVDLTLFATTFAREDSSLLYILQFLFVVTHAFQYVFEYSTHPQQ